MTTAPTFLFRKTATGYLGCFIPDTRLLFNSCDCIDLTMSRIGQAIRLSRINHLKCNSKYPDPPPTGKAGLLHDHMTGFQIALHDLPVNSSNLWLNLRLNSLRLIPHHAQTHKHEFFHIVSFRVHGGFHAAGTPLLISSR